MDQSPWRSWFERRTFGPPDPDPQDLLSAKAAAGLSLSVCLPALNEAATISDVVASLRHLRSSGLVDEILVSDSGSTDGTRDLAERAGAEVVSGSSTGFDEKVRKGGKGGAMWRAAAVAAGDIIFFLDADVLNFGPHYVTRLLAPLLADPHVMFVKAFYERPITRDDGSIATGGARVTELGMRPLLQILHPELTGLVQPLAGECAIRRETLLNIPLVSGYGVEAGMLVDVVQRHGVDAVAQVDLGIRVHRNRTEEVLGETSFQVIQGLLMRLDDHGLIKLPEDLPDEYVRFDAAGNPHVSAAGVTLLPPPAAFVGHDS